MYNRLPDRSSGLCPDEVWSQIHCAHTNFTRVHVFGCPVYVLDHDFADGYKIPKWSPRFRLGMFLGLSLLHSSLVPLVLNLATGKVSSCFHLVFDDTFSTVNSLPANESLEEGWARVLKLDHETFIDLVDFRDEEGSFQTELLPVLDPVWFPLEDSAPREDSRGATDPTGDTAQVLWQSPCLHPSQDLTAANAATWGQLPTWISNIGGEGRTSFRPWRRFQRDYLINTWAIAQSSWSKVRKDFHALPAFFTRDRWDTALVKHFDPRILGVKLSKYDADNPRYKDAITGPYQDEYYEAMCTELEILEHPDINAWTSVERPRGVKVLPSKWVFKCKPFPDGTLKKFKTCFVVRGDRQVKGVDYFKRWAPVVHWSTVQMIMILAAKLNLCSAQCDITATFIHAHLADNKHIYVDQPKGLECESPGGRHYWIKLNCSVYGICQAPRDFFKFLNARLEGYCLKPSEPNPCLFLSKDLIIIVYVKNLLVYARRNQGITAFVEKMKKEEVQLRRKGTAKGFHYLDATRIHGANY